MSVTDFLGILAGCTLIMLICRLLPLLLLGGRELPPAVSRALSLIPPAAFAALVANDLFSPAAQAAGPAAWAPAVAAAVVVGLVAWKTKSMVGCVVAGLLAYALFTWLFTLV